MLFLRTTIVATLAIMAALLAQPAFAFTECATDADCGGGQCEKAAQAICPSLNSPAADICTARPVSGISSECGNTLGQDVGGIRGTENVFGCKIDHDRCVLDEEELQEQCTSLVNADDRFNGKKFCTVAPVASAPSGPEPELQFTPTPPTLGIPIPTLREFSKVELQGPEGQRYLLIPWLAQYIAAFYRYALAIIGTITVVMIIFGGLRWMLAAGDSGSISEAKKMITNAVIGLLIALGTTAILAVINPEILRFRALKISFASRAEFSHISEAPLSPDEESSLPGERPQFLCTSVASCQPLCANIEGSVSPSLPRDCAGGGFARLDGIPGIKNNDADFFCLRSEIADKLREVGQLAQNDPQGPYEIRLNAAFRPVTRQLRAVCTKIQQGDTAGLGTLIGWPGGSIHGTGAAVDAFLVKNGVRVAEGHKKLAELFFRAGWVRYCKEWWHFEYGTGNLVCRSNSCDWVEKSCTRP